ncbi:hypothetical protein EJ08DRAFT_465503 [Tothia fuscella]|uniref:Uncharacterized protein n=1 Tax=Tothia fuscella TaxID=1048955 RepID=A0A9P4P0D1_9PEZI|nr:hypothetical protein EJ08DRAFT_465503 [Tothia fuscella]
MFKLFRRLTTKPLAKPPPLHFFDLDPEVKLMIYEFVLFSNDSEPINWNPSTRQLNRRLYCWAETCPDPISSLLLVNNEINKACTELLSKRSAPFRFSFNHAMRLHAQIDGHGNRPGPPWPICPPGGEVAQLLNKQDVRCMLSIGRGNLSFFSRSPGAEHYVCWLSAILEKFVEQNKRDLACKRVKRPRTFTVQINMLYETSAKPMQYDLPLRWNQLTRFIGENGVDINMTIHYWHGLHRTWVCQEIKYLMSRLVSAGVKVHRVD